MKSICPPCAEARTDGLEALPALLTLARQMVVGAFDSGDPESDELRSLLEACIVGALRLRLRERLRAQHAWRRS